MARNSIVNIDESKVVKKQDTTINSNNVAQPVTKKEDTISEPIDTIDIKSTEMNNVISNDKNKEYFDIVNQYQNDNFSKEEIVPIVIEKSNEEIIEKPQEKQVGKKSKKSQMPVYNYSKDLNTKSIVIEVKNEIQEEIKEEQQQYINKNLTNNEKRIIQELLNTTNDNLIKTDIEIKIHLEIIKTESDPKKKELYQMKIKSFGSDFEFYTKRKKILEDMLRG